MAYILGISPKSYKVPFFFFFKFSILWALSCQFNNWIRVVEGLSERNLFYPATKISQNIPPIEWSDTQRKRLRQQRLLTDTFERFYWIIFFDYSYTSAFLSTICIGTNWAPKFGYYFQALVRCFSFTFFSRKKL